MTESLRAKTWRILEPADDGDTASRTFDVLISVLIILAVGSVILESVPRFSEQYKAEFKLFEYFCLLVFSIEYVSRLWACGETPEYSGISGRLKWACSFMAIIDLLAILPGLLMVSAIDLRFLRSVRLLRLLRLGRYNRGVKMISATFVACGRQLAVALSGVFILLIVASGALYYAERTVQPEAFGTIPDAMWWAVCTLTTVGYGDVYPITVSGKILASMIAILGVGTFALPAGIIAANFEKTLDNGQPQKTCPHCGRKI